MRRALTLEHAADAAIHCTLAGLFVGLVCWRLTMKVAAEGY